MASRKPISVAEINPVTPSSTMSAFSKWVPLICAGAAVGVSVLALKEIKNLRKELIVMKKDSNTDTELSKQVERMDEQLRKITEYLVKQKEKKVVKKQSPVIRNASPQQKIEEVNIVNDDEDEEVEYVEVTDDEED